MPDFGLTDALAAALRGAKSAEVMRPAERVLAERSAATAADAGPGAARAAGAAQAPPVADPAMQAIHVQAPVENPSLPPQDVPVPPAETAAAAPGAAPTPQPAAAAATSAAPGGAASGLSPAVLDDSAMPSTQPPGPKGSPTAVPGVLDPAETGAKAPTAPASKLPPQGPQPAAEPPTVQAQAQRFMTANLGAVKADALNVAHMPNVNVIDSPDSFKAALLQVASDNREAIDAASRGTVPDAQLIGLAEDLSTNLDTVKQVLGRVVGTNLPSPEVGLAARMIANDQLGNLFALSDKVAAGTATPEEIVAWEQHRHLVNDFVTQLQGAKAESGRTLRALGLQIPGELPPQVMDHVAQVIQQGNPDMQATAQAIKLAGTPKGIANIVHGMGVLKRAGKASFHFLQRMFINGILSGPPTWLKIFTGNNFNLALNTADIYAAGVGRGVYGLASRLAGFPSAVEGATIGDAIAHVHGVISAGADGLRVAGRVLKTGQSMDGILRAEEGAAPAAHDQRTLDYLPELNRGYLGHIVHGIDVGIDAPGRLIGGIDQFTQTLGFRGYATMQTLKEIRARLTAGTLRPGDAEQIARDMMENMTPEMQQAAEAWGHRMTFQTPFPGGGVGEAFQKVLEKAPALRFIFPFMRTATNIFKQSLIERTPLAAFSARLRAQIAGGGFEGDLAKSRIATGTAIGSMLAWMAIHDRITGDAPKDPKERGQWSMDGRQPYSIRYTDPITGKEVWRSYAWFEPMATVAGAVADAVSLQSYIHAEDGAGSLMPHDDMLNDAIAHIMASIITNTGNKTFMQGAAKFSEMYNDPKRAFQMWFDETAASMMPFSGMTKFLRNEQDPYMRQAFSLMDKIRDQLPTIAGKGGSKTLMPRLDVFGQPRPTYSGNSILGPLNPMPAQTVTHDPVADELQAVMAFTHVVPITMPAKQLAILGNGRGLQDGEGMRLTPQEYYEYTKFSRNDPIFDGGKLNFHDKLEQTINSSLYQGSTPAERVVLLEQIQNQADKIGRARLFKEDPDFRERMLEWTAEKNRLKYNQ